MSGYANPLPTLKKLPLRQQSAFALACAIRIRELGENELSKEAVEALSQALRAIEEFVSSGKTSPDLEVYSQTVESLGELDDDRVAVGAYLLRHIISREPDNAAWVAQRASDACGFLVDRAIEKGIFSDSIAKIPENEVRFQEGDLASLFDKDTRPIEIVEKARHNVYLRHA
jgi:hypothetical protein